MGDDLSMLLAALDQLQGSINNATNIVATENLNSKNRAWQSAEAEKSRLFNAEQAQLAFERQQEFYDMNMSMSARMRQYKEAGVNPILATEGSAPSAPQVNSSAPASPSGGSSTGFNPLQAVSMLKQLIDIKRSQAEVDNINADTEQKQKETSWIDIYNTNEIETMKAGVKQVESNIQKNSQEVNESIQRVQESLKRMDVMSSEIEVNGALVDLHGSTKVVNETKAALNRLDAQKIELLLPYIQMRQEAEIALTNAKTDEAKNSAESLMYDANLKMLKSMVDAKLIDSSYYDSVIEQAHWDVKYKKREYKWKPVNDICHNVSMLAVGAGSVIP